MDFSESRAAVDAMAALQARIQELQKGNAELRKEVTRLRQVAAEDESVQCQREAALMEAADRAAKMLEGASQTMIELRRVRKENRELQLELEQLQEDISKRYSSDTRASVVAKKTVLKQQNIAQLISEYEDLFCEILSPPPSVLEITGNLPFNSTTCSSITYSLPATLQTTIQLLQNLPFPFKDQPLEKKREIVSVLLQARDIACKMYNEIEELEIQKRTKGTVRRLQPEINVKRLHLKYLTQAMSRFSLE